MDLFFRHVSFQYVSFSVSGSQVGPIKDQSVLVQIFGKHVDPRAAQQFQECDFPQPGPCTVTAESPICSLDTQLSVAKSFKGATVLITGAVGYVGSVALEQLLRLCPEIKKIYLVVRYVNPAQTYDKCLPQQRI